MISKIFINSIRCTCTSVRLFSQVLHPTPIRFEAFFRQVQKATTVGEVINIYQQQSKNSVDTLYLAATLRLLTRIMRKGQQEDYEKIQDFMKTSFQVMKSLDLSKLKAAEMKDFLLFFLHYAEEAYKISSSKRELVQNFLKQFLTFYKNQDNNTRVQYLPVFASCSRLAHRCTQLLVGQFLLQIQRVIQDNSTLFIRDSLTFLSFLKVSQLTFAPYNKIYRSFSMNLMKTVLATNLSAFTMSACTQILITALKIKKATALCLFNSEIFHINELINKTEFHIKNSIMNACQKDIEELVNHLLNVDPESPLIKDIFELIIGAVGKKGECSINPIIVLWCLPLLREQHIYLLNNNWGDKLILLLQRYFDNRQFTKTIDHQLRLIIKNRLLSWLNNQQVYQFYLKYTQLAKKLTLFSSELHSAELHSLQLEQSSLQKSLIRIEEWICQIQSYWPQHTKRYGWMKSPYQFQKNLPKFQYIGKIQYDTFMNEFSSKIFLTKIKIFYLQNNHNQVQKLFQQDSQNRSLSQKIKAELVKGLLIQVKLYEDHIPLAIKWLSSLFEDKSLTQFQDCVLKVLFDYFKQGSRPFDYYAVNQVWAFAKIRPEWTYNLLFVHPRLLNLMIYYKYSEIVELVFRWFSLKNHLIYKYQPVIFQMMCRSVQLSNDQSLVFWKKLNNVIKNMPYDNLQIIAGFIIKSNISHIPLVQRNFQSISLYESKELNQQKKKISLIELKANYLSHLSERDRLLTELIELSDWDLLSRLDKIQMIALPQKKNNQWILLCSRLLRKIEKTKYSFKWSNKFVDQLIMQFAEVGSRFETSSHIKIEVLRFFIENSIYCSALNIDNVSKLNIAPLSNPRQIIRYISRFPATKLESFMLENIEHLSVINSVQDIAFLFALTDRPSSSLVNWLKKWVTNKQLPIFFQTYLQFLHPQIHKELSLSLFQFDKNVTPQLFLEKMFNQKNNDFFNIETKESIESCQKLIVRKIMKTSNQKIKIIFPQVSEKPKASFFKRN